MVARKSNSNEASGAQGLRTIWSINIPTVAVTIVVLTIQAVVMYSGINARVGGLELSVSSSAKAAESRETQWAPKVDGLMVRDVQKDVRIDLLTDSLKEQRVMNERILAQLVSVREDLAELRAKVEPGFRQRGRP